MRTAPAYQRHRFPPAAIIAHAVWRYFRFALSCRDVEELLAERGVVLTYETVRQCETVRQWCRTFGQQYAKAITGTPALACAARPLRLATPPSTREPLPRP